MDQSDPQFLVKVLSGPHLGAEVELPAGEFRFGRGAECDVVFSDSTVTEDHLTLAITPEGVKVVAAAARVQSDGATLEVGADVPFFRTLAIGTTQFAIGPLGDPWPDAAESPNGGAEDEQWSKFKTSPPANVPYVEEVPAEVGNTPPPGFWQRPLVRLARALVIGFLISGAIALPFHFRNGDQLAEPSAPSTPSEPEVSPQQQFERLLVDLELAKDLRVAEGSRGRLLVEGYVDDNATRIKVASEARTRGLPLQMRVVTGEQLVASANQTLEALDTDLSVDYIGDGSLQLEGYVEDSGRLEATLEMLKRDVVGVNEIKTNVETQATVVDALRREIARSELGSLIRLRLMQDQTLVAEGAVTADEAIAWNSVNDWFQAQHGDKVKLVAEVTQSSASLAPPPGIDISIRAVVHRPMPYVVLQDGEKYLEGSQLSDGSTIEAIKQGVIVLTRDGRTFEYRYRL